MRADRSQPDGPATGIAVSRRGTLATLAAVARNPLDATPPECFREPIVAMPIFGRPRFYLCDPELIHEAYVSNADRLSKGPTVSRILAPAFGDGLLSAEGAHWRHQRRAASPAFVHDKLTNCLPAMIGAAEHTRDAWLEARGPIDVSRAMTATTFAIIADTMLSGAGTADAARFERELGFYLEATGWMAAISMAGLPALTPFPGRRRAMAAAGWLRSTVDRLVAERRGTVNEATSDLLGLLLAARDAETGHRLSDREITDNILTFIAAGHETTAQGLAWTLRLLADAQDAEAEVIGEIEAATAGGVLRPNHIPQLDATRRVFLEAMRLYPPAPLIERRVERAMTLGGRPVAAGSILVVPIHALHRHAALWDEPDTFDPSRFAPARADARHRYSYMPFGAGPRTCIGMGFALFEAVAILAVLLRALRLTPTDPALPRPRMRLTLRPDRPILMQVERRRSTATDGQTPVPCL